LDPDDIAYKKSVRNMSMVLVAMAVVVFAAIFIPPYLFPSHEVFPSSVSYDFGSGFTMNLTLNSTTLAAPGHLLLMGWLNSSSDSVENATAADSWAFSEGLLWVPQCTAGWPIGFGLMSGHYTQDNYTLGTLLQPSVSSVQCPASEPPQYFLFYPHSTEALAIVNGNPQRWTITMNVTLGQGSLSPSALPGVSGQAGLPAGVYTVVLADEWGDVLTANFRVS
jgi:hypothetical protein